MKPTHSRTSRADDDQRVHWRTPPWVLQGVRAVFMGQIDLDPCANLESIHSVRAKVNFVLDAPDIQHTIMSPPTKGGHVECRQVDRDGLKTNWDLHDKVGQRTAFVNPPYGRAYNDLWAQKFASETAGVCRIQGIGVQVIALVPASTGAAWFRKYIDRASAVAFIGRLKFIGAPAHADFDSALIYAGREPDTFLKVFENDGWGVKL